MSEGGYVIHTARAIVQGKVDSPGQVQTHKSRAKAKDKIVAACQGNSHDERKIRTKTKKQEARAIAEGKGIIQDMHFCTNIFQDFSRPKPRQ